MRITDTPIDGLLIIEPDVYEDRRGYFFESYSERKYREKGIDTHFVQDNESKSQAGVLRGLHYQVGEFAQSKLVRVIKGAVWDVAVDIREDSPTYGEWYGHTLSAANKKQLYIPKGFAHGFLVLEEDTVFSYKCDNFYNQIAEAGILYNDEKLSIDWPELDQEIIISDKDMQHPDFGKHKKSGIEYE
jgi:dTDP-4-dehydrorhamnose 3,5-epimerase